MTITRLLKRPQQSLPLLLWGLTVTLWLVLSLSSGSTLSESSTESDEDGQGNGNVRESIPMSRVRRGHSQERISYEDGSLNSRLQQTPLPIHPSQPDFPNVPIAVHLPANDGSNVTEEEVETELTSIWDLGDNRFWRMDCEGQDHLPKRYQILKDLAADHSSSQKKYFFALNLYQVRDLLPRLMGTLVHAIKMLGPEKCAVSIVEGRSVDGTYAVLLALKQKLETIGVEVYLGQSDINPRGEGVDRIGALSELRNMALYPLMNGVPSVKFNETAESVNDTANDNDNDNTSKETATQARRAINNNDGPNTAGNLSELPLYDNNTVIVFINDVALCTDDIYELLFQHEFQSAHQTCAMDWVHGGNLFYDSWVSRSMSGDLFFEVPQDVSFGFAGNMFWDHPLTKDKFKRKQPFQVYSCWGGMVTLSSAPFLEQGIRVRNSTKEECYAGEPVTLAKDFWATGYGKILTVPTVNVGYNNHDGKRIKKRRGWVKDSVEVEKTENEWKGTELIEWKTKPPGQVKCMPGWGNVGWTEP